MNRRGDPYPRNPARPPRLVEPDGKRFTVQHQQVTYMGWSFNFRISPLSGPAIYDVRFKGDRIAYEIALSELAVYYSGHAPLVKLLDTIDSLYLFGVFAKAVIPGGDCPETAVFAGMTLAGQVQRQSARFSHSFCLFEQNDGIPLRRHLSYGEQYAGMLDSYLVLRTIVAIGNYDYILDFMFHQNGVVDVRVTSTGYMVVTPFTPEERNYGFHIHEGIIGNIHHHLFHFKADLDVSGTSNRYETLDISNEETNSPWAQGQKYNQIKFRRNLRRTEKAALYDYNFDAPKYHIVHNNATRTNLDEIKAYRIALTGMSKQMLPEGVDNEPSVSWARHQVAVTRHKDDEYLSSSPYAGMDSFNPVTNFSNFYEDDEDIMDKDLVFWLTVGMHHIPHTEDLPVTASTATKIGFSLSPYNYFPECPSMGSRDAIRIEYKDEDKPEEGVNLITYSERQGTCTMEDSDLKSQLEEDPDIALKSKNPIFVLS